MTPNAIEMEDHWSRTLFIDHPELFLPGLEAHEEIASKEADKQNIDRRIPSTAAEEANLAASQATLAYSVCNFTDVQKSMRDVGT
jgi:hypothetical protein